MKKLISLLLTLAMLFSLAVPAMAAEDTRTIYFENTDNWSTVNAYAWDAESIALLGTWPGSAMTKVEGEENIYSIEVPTDAVNMIFNNGSAQTGDLTIPTDGKNLYTYNSGWSTYGSTGDEPTVTGNKEGDVTASYTPVISVSDIILSATYNDGCVTVDEANKTYIVTIPAGEPGASVTATAKGTNLDKASEYGEIRISVAGLQYDVIGSDVQNGEYHWNILLAPDTIGLTDLQCSFDAGVSWTNTGWKVDVRQGYAVTFPDTMSNGTVTADKAFAAEGDTVTLTVTPEVGYELDELTVTYVDADGVTQNVIVTDNAFTMPAFAVTVTATFQQATETYTVTVDENIANGTVVVNPTTYTAGQTVTLAVTPAEGYKLTNLTVTNTATGEPVTVSENNTFVMPDGNVTVTATFKATYTIRTSTTGDVGGSTISVPASAAEGDIITVTLNPAEGYTPLNFQVVEDVNFFEVPFTKVNETTYTFVMPAQNVLIEVDFCLPGTTLDAIYYKGTWTNVEFEFLNSTSNYAGEVKGTMKETGIYEATPIPEWSYYLLIRNLDNEGEILSWIRIPTDGRNMYNAETGEWETYTPSTPAVTSAEITWGSMSFTYTDGENGAEGAWSCEDGANKITVTNTGDNAFNAQPLYDAKEGYTEIEGVFYESMEATVNTMYADLYSGDSFTFYLKLKNQPSKALNGETIATVTIRITEGIGE